MTKSEIKNLEYVRGIMRAELDVAWREAIVYNPTTPHLHNLLARVEELRGAIQAIDTKIAEEAYTDAFYL